MYGITSGFDPLKFKSYLVYIENTQRRFDFATWSTLKRSKFMFLWIINFKINRNVFYPKILEILMVKFYLNILNLTPHIDPSLHVIAPSHNGVKYFLLDHL